jgi:hypothetical protein
VAAAASGKQTASKSAEKTKKNGSK